MSFGLIGSIIADRDYLISELDWSLKDEKGIPAFAPKAEMMHDENGNTFRVLHEKDQQEFYKSLEKAQLKKAIEEEKKSKSTKIAN